MVVWGLLFSTFQVIWSWLCTTYDSRLHFLWYADNLCLFFGSFPHQLPALTDKGKFLLAARRYRCGTHTEYIISLDADDLSQGSNAYVGKLR